MKKRFIKFIDEATLGKFRTVDTHVGTMPHPDNKEGFILFENVKQAITITSLKDEIGGNVKVDFPRYMLLSVANAPGDIYTAYKGFAFMDDNLARVQQFAQSKGKEILNEQPFKIFIAKG